MTQQQSDKTIVLYPPRIALGAQSNKYKLVVNVRWGDFEKEFEVDRETPGMWQKLINEVNIALLEGSEQKPYITK